jgi:hypothetical protein
LTSYSCENVSKFMVAYCNLVVISKLNDLSANEVS